MEFRVLGPLTVHDGAAPVVVGGVKQRAVLGFLLLHANEVVATRTLLGAVWPEPPPTARKMLQNAVSGLRGLFSQHASGTAPMLLTHAPGYLLRIPPDDLDLVIYRSQVEAGRAELADGAWDAAAKTLRAALDLWRGPVLADLLGTGLDWSEPAMIDQGRHRVLEDVFEAELALGRHAEVIEPLSLLLEADPVRERLCAELLVALYRCDRQSEALDHYRRTRRAFVEQLGLEPGPLLREIERAILDHDQVLRHPDVLRVLAGQRPVVKTGEPRLSSVTTIPFSARDWPVAALKSAPPVPHRTLGGLTEQRKQLSTLLVLPGSAAVAERDPELVAALSVTIREEIERHEGTLSGVFGPVTFGLFGMPRTHESDAARAVRAGLSLRNRLVGHDPAVRVAVVTGEAVVTCAPDGSGSFPVAGGTVPDSCAEFLQTVPAGEVRVCEVTRVSSDRTVSYVRDQSGGWKPIETSSPETTVPRLSLVDRDGELAGFGAMLDDVARRRRPHVLTLLGEPGIGKTRMAEELARLADERAFTVLNGQSGRSPGGTPQATVAQIVARSAGIEDGDTAATVDDKLVRAVMRTGAAGAAADRLCDGLRALAADRPIADRTEAFEVWRAYLTGLTGERPLLLVFENLHDADDLVLDFAAYLADSGGSVPLLLAVTARPEFLDSRPEWGAGLRDALTRTLDPLTPAGTARLLAELLSPESPLLRHPDLVGLIGGNPLFAIEYARAAHAGSHPVPPYVHRLVAARLDTLTPDAKAVLVSASALGLTFSADGVAAVSGFPESGVVKMLDELDRRQFLRRSAPAGPGAPARYSFRYPATRDVVWASISRSVRADREFRARAWCDSQPEAQAWDRVRISG